jgi:hypothetical protein
MSREGRHTKWTQQKETLPEDEDSIPLDDSIRLSLQKAANMATVTK